MTNVKQCLAELSKISIRTFGHDFLLTWEKYDAEIRALTLVAECLLELHRTGKPFRIFDTGLAVSIFHGKSSRARVSFAAAANALGLAVADLNGEKSHNSHRQTALETATTVSSMAEVIGIRDDLCLGDANHYMHEVAVAVERGFQEGVLHQRPSVVNLECDIDHPTQTLADLLHLKHHFGSLEKLAGKKLVMSWAYSPGYGEPLSVPQGIIGLMTRFGMHVTLAHPEGYNLMPEALERARTNSVRADGHFEVVPGMEDAFRDADVVYPKFWAPCVAMQERIPLLKAGDQDGLEVLRKECLANNGRFKHWECDERKMKLTRGGAALYMHCPPADVTGVGCTHGGVSAGVFEKHRLATCRQASYHPFVIAAMILMGRRKDLTAVLEKLCPS